RNWLATSPNWLKVRPIDYGIDSTLALLDPGEQAAILLAQRYKANLLLLDDMQARQAATAKGIAITGMLGILDQAATENLVNLPLAVQALRSTSFWISEKLLQTLLNKHRL
ncbi:MAG: DUF3368 domain-containing protein, partial [Leptolyngbya sp. SIO4C1]|nr:DUF3368 domain-containing protein [Leptolyngbya sp. SIO4C1]